MNRITGYLRLMRVPNIVTAVSDILAGVAIGGSLISMSFIRQNNRQISLGELIVENKTMGPVYPILLLILSTICLYGGGVVLNDVFDADLDKIERPERPIPSGVISKKSAAVFGFLLLLIGITSAAFTDIENYLSPSTFFAVAIAIAAVVYDKWMKHNKILGPLNMGVCRGLNLLLGMSLVPVSLQFYWMIALVPVLYIAAITMISRGEVHGGKKTTLYLASVFYILVILVMLTVSYLNYTLPKTLPFVILFSLLIFIPLQKAIIKPEGPMIGKAVKSGVIALIAMNAAWAAAFGDIIFAVLIILLLPFTILLARLFAVT